MTIDRQQFLDELKLREQIRRAIAIIGERKQNQQTQMLAEEKRLRKVIRKLLKEEEGQGDESTGISYLRRDLKKIIPELEGGYKALRSKKEQRDSYRAHIISALKDIILRGDTNFNAKSDGDALADGVDAPIDSGLNEEIDVNFGDSENFPDPAKKLDIGREKPEELQAVEDDNEENKELDDFSIEGEDKTGAAAALTSMKQIEKVVINTYSTLYDPTDRELYADYLITNTQLYFDEFEKELQTIIPEPENPEYEKRKEPEAAELDVGEPEIPGISDEEINPL
jgi:hypothetical protein